MPQHHAPVVGSTSTILFCGAPQPLTAADFDSQEPWRIQFLLIQDPPPPRLDRPKSNGCGAKVHNGAIPKRAVWHGAHASATHVVLPLDDEYVPQALKTVVETRRKDCGCSRNPVGCAVCGNTLGVLIVGCAIHAYLESTYEFVPSAVSPPIPASLRRWRPPTPRARDTLLSRTVLARRFTQDDDATPRSARGRRAWRHNPPPVGMNGEDRAENAALFSDFHDTSGGFSAGPIEFSLGHGERDRPTSPLAGQLFSFLWTGPSRGFIPGSRAARPGRF
ncbi:hypothetical protein B0H13DRAFT_2025501 [Mycena leptocephala]|nr:hypothetical protein B0H13DRAFT_2025501 [Mycena leptocephala]